MKRYKKLLINIILICILICTFSPDAFAEVTITGQMRLAANSTVGDVVGDAGNFLNQGKNENSPINEEALKDGSSLIYNVLLTIGIGVALIWGLVLGIQFITGSLEEKADVKKGLTIYVIGCIIIFGAFAIWRLVITLLEPLAG